MLSLVLPTYNEAENLPLLLPKIEEAMRGLPFEVIVVDDNSPDRTWETARLFSEKREWLRVIRRVGRRGLSSAVIEGFLAARGDILAVADADGQHDLSLLPKLAEAAKTADLAVGSRYVPGGSVGEWDERRYALSRMGTRLAQALCAVKVQDPMSGFFAIQRHTFEKVLPLLNPKGFKILLDLLVHMPADAKVAEVPFVFQQRLRGESKLSMAVQLQFLEYLYDVAVGRYVPFLFIKYCLVGLLGVVVQSVTYELINRFILPGDTATVFGLPRALPLAVEVAIICNFVLNNFWSFSHARLKGSAAFWGLLRYNLACVVGALTTLALYSFFIQRGLTPLQALAIGSFVGTMWNYNMSRIFTWKV